MTSVTKIGKRGGARSPQLLPSPILIEPLTSSIDNQASPEMVPPSSGEAGGALDRVSNGHHLQLAASHAQS